MKSLTNAELLELSGGGFWDGFCAGVAAVDAGASIAVALGATINPIVGGVLLGAGIGCAAYGLAKL